MRELYSVTLNTGCVRKPGVLRQGGATMDYYHTVRAMNGKRWEYKTLDGVQGRIEALTGKRVLSETVSWKTKTSSGDTLDMEVRLKLPGTPCGYVSFDKVKAELEKNGFVRISFARFYDARQEPDWMKDCFIEIKRVA